MGRLPMKREMLVRRSGEAAWRELDESGYADENQLQALLAEAPHLIPGTPPDLVVVRELTVATGSVDLVGLGPGGEIVVCECKLDSNEDARRKVVGQILSYAAALWEMPATELLTRFSRRLGSDAAAAVEAASGDQAWETTTWLAALEANLRMPRLQLVVVVNSISDELRRTITLLNSSTGEHLSLLALELSHQRDGDVEMLNPRSYGEESARSGGSRVAGHRMWDEKSFLAALDDACDTTTRPVMRELYDALTREADGVNWGSGLHGSASFVSAAADPPTSVISIYTGPGQPSINVNFDFVRERLPQPTLDGLLERSLALPHGRERFGDVRAKEFRRRTGPTASELAQRSDVVEEIAGMMRWLRSEAAQ